MGYLFTVIIKFSRLLIAGTAIHSVLSIGGIYFYGAPVLYTSAAYAYAIAVKADWHWGLATLIALLVALALSVFYSLVYRRLDLRAFMILSLLSLLALESLLVSWQSLTNGTLGLTGISRPDFINGLGGLAIVAALLAAGAFALQFIALRTVWGRRLRAFKEDKQVLAAMGTSPKWMGMLVVGLAGLGFGLAGIVTIWQVQSISPNFGHLPFLVEMITIGVIGSSVRMRYLLLGVAFIVFVQESLRFIGIPSGIVGNLRILIYTVLLFILFKYLQPKLQVNTRKV